MLWCGGVGIKLHTCSKLSSCALAGINLTQIQFTQTTAEATGECSSVLELGTVEFKVSVGVSVVWMNTHLLVPKTNQASTAPDAKCWAWTFMAYYHHQHHHQQEHHCRRRHHPRGVSNGIARRKRGTTWFQRRALESCGLYNFIGELILRYIHTRTKAFECCRSRGRGWTEEDSESIRVINMYPGFIGWKWQFTDMQINGSCFRAF